MQSQQTPTSSAGRVSDARWGTLSRRPMGTFLSWFRGTREWWLDSKQRLVATELRRIPRRILAMWADSFLRYGPALPSDPRHTSPQSLAQENTFLLSCSEDIKALSRKHEWMGPLDQQLAGEAFRLGASWAFGTLDSCKEADDMESRQS
jgi:hypothetical protein